MNSDSNNIKNYSAEDIRRYWNNEMSSQEMHALEIAAMDDPFLADALEGYSRLEKNPEDEIAILRKRLAERASGATVISMKKNNWWKVAAVLILLAGLGTITFNMLERNEKGIAQNESAKDNKAKQAPIGNTSIPSTVPSQRSNDSDSVNAGSSYSLNNANVTQDSKQLEFKDLKPVKPSQKERREITRADTLSSFVAGGASEVAADEYKKSSAPVARQKTAQSEIINSVDTSKLSKSDDRAKAEAETLQHLVYFNNFSGKVVDVQNKSIPFATVKMNNANQVTATDQYGMFQFKSKDTVADIHIVSPGYQDKSLTLYSNQSGLITMDRDIAKKKMSEAEVSASSGTVSPKRKSAPSDLKVYVMDAEPVVGWDKYNQYLDSNKRISPNDNTLTGEVVVSFKVNQKGELSSFDIEQSLSKVYDNEAIRLIKEGPAWRVTRGKKTRVKVIVRF